MLVSGLLSPAGNEALIIPAVNHGLIRLCLSAAVLAEYAEVLARPKFGFPPDAIAAVLEVLRTRGELIDPKPDAPNLPDPDDAKFVQCAVAAQAEYLVTGNKRHFPSEMCGAVDVVNAVELLDRITREIGST